jgi:hypothetical protein
MTMTFFSFSKSIRPWNRSPALCWRGFTTRYCHHRVVLIISVRVHLDTCGLGIGLHSGSRKGQAAISRTESVSTSGLLVSVDNRMSFANYPV